MGKKREIKNTDDNTLCTQTYYAQRVGKSKAWVNQAMQYGKIETVTVLGGLRLIKLPVNGGVD